MCSFLDSRNISIALMLHLPPRARSHGVRQRLRSKPHTKRGHTQADRDAPALAPRHETLDCTTDGGLALKVRDTGKLRLIIQQSGTSSETITSNTTISTGVWHHVAGVFDGSQKRLYIDGVLDKTLSSTYSPATGSSNLFIGASPDGTNKLNGLIDEVRVTARAVYSASFTAQHRLTGVVDTKGLWRFDRQNAKDCADIHNGTLVGGATFSSSVP